MHIPKDAMLLRIFFGENNRFEQQSLSEAIVLKAREMHLAGATVLRGPMGLRPTQPPAHRQDFAFDLKPRVPTWLKLS
jgi:PII-like signaling protein